MLSNKYYLVDLDNLAAIDSEVHVYATDLKHHLIFMNETAHKFFQETLHTETHGVSLKELFKGNEQAVITLELENQQIIETNKPQFFHNRLNLAHGTHIDFLTIKFPIYNQEHQLAGVLGFSHYLEKSSALPAYSMGLTKREIDCLFLLLEGMSYKQIASSLALSTRTIESYIENIKNKLECDNKQDLLKKAKESKIKTEINEMIGFSSVDLTINKLSIPPKKPK